ncbi:MAG: hypothetical protein QQN62_07235 [Nitrosopumilus sp.]|nr:hypothetical protein [Nitrososphaerota archaeon]
MKIDNVILNAVNYFERFDDNALRTIVLNELKKLGVIGKKYDADLLVRKSKELINYVKKNEEIYSEAFMIILLIALSKYVEKLSDEISQCDMSESMDKIRKLRDEKLNADSKIVTIFRSLQST